MSLAFESPTHRGNGTTTNTDAYFTPLSMPSLLNNNTSANTTTTTYDESTANTPYYTAPINPAIHQDFLNAIQARHSSQPTVLTQTTPILERPAFNLNMGSLAARRQQSPSLSTNTSSASAILKPLEPTTLHELLRGNETLLVLDVRSFVQYSHSRIRDAINVSIPNTILKRPTFTLDKVYEAIVLDGAREKLKNWSHVNVIAFYDQQSVLLQENSACTFLASKLLQAGFKGQLNYLKGGFEAFVAAYQNDCESNNNSNSGIGNNGLSAFQLQQQQMMKKMASTMGPPTIAIDTAANRRPNLRLNNLPMATPSLGPFTAPMPQFENQAFNPFFSNIRQNMELSHGPIRERFPIRLPSKCNVDPSTFHVEASKNNNPRCLAGGHMLTQTYVAPNWLQSTINETGAQLLAETYEKLERTEQRRLQNIMHFHSKHTDNPAEFPFSIVAGIEMGALNRYTNIWPFEYTRVKIHSPQASDYINASYVQYIDSEESVSDARPDQVNTTCVNAMKNYGLPNSIHNYFRRYISTQGPLPTTFNDFWQVVWEQNSRVLVMLTKEEEMNKIKCHRYWPSVVNSPTKYGHLMVTLTEQTIQPVPKVNPEDVTNEDDVVIVRQLTIFNGSETRQVTHLQYTGWMDFGVPDNPLGTLQIIHMADKAQLSFAEAGPMIVHCSAGCGRSGAFCAIDTVLYRLSTEKNASDKDILLQTISRFREQRLSMVQTLRQFVFCYEAVWWWLLGYGLDKTIISNDNNSMDTSL